MIRDDDQRIDIRANWPSKVPPTQNHIAKVRDDPTCLQPSNGVLVPGSFDILLVEGLGSRFAGNRTFIEDLERVVPEFYALVGQHLRSWQAAPPRPVNEPRTVLPEIADVNTDRKETESRDVAADQAASNQASAEEEAFLDAETQENDGPVFALYVAPEETAAMNDGDNTHSASDAEP